MARNAKLTIGPRLPIEVIDLILDQLPASDLLSWRRVNTVYRKTLEPDKRWDDALQRGQACWLVPPPPRPRDLKGYQYAEILLRKACKRCNRRKGLVKLWEIRLTLCRPCAAKLPRDFSLSAQKLIPAARFNKFRGTLNPFKYARVSNTLQRLKRKPWALKIYQALCISHTNMVRKHADALYEWEKACIAARLDITTQKKVDRHTAILDRLRECGYERDVDDFGEQLKDSRHVIFHNRGILSEKMWRQYKDELIKALRDMRVAHDTKRRKDLISQLHHEWCVESKLPFSRCPPDDEILLFFSGLSYLHRLPIDMHVSQPTIDYIRSMPHTAQVSAWLQAMVVFPFYEAAFESAPQMVAPAHARKDEAWLSEVNMDCMLPALRRAAVVFRPGPSGDVRIADARRMHYPMIVDSIPLGHRISPTFDLSTSANIQTLVASCGLDPIATTWQEMHALDARFVCKTCLDGPQAEVFGWWSAVHHLQIVHVNKTAECLRLSPAIETKVIGTDAPPCPLEWYRCKMCWTTSAKTNCFRKREEVLGHCMTAHNLSVDALSATDDYVISDSPPKECTSQLGELRLGRYIRDVHIAKDVALQVAPARRRTRGLSLKALFGTGLSHMNLFSLSH